MICTLDVLYRWHTQVYVASPISHRGFVLFDHFLQLAIAEREVLSGRTGGIREMVLSRWMEVYENGDEPLWDTGWPTDQQAFRFEARPSTIWRAKDLFVDNGTPHLHNIMSVLVSLWCYRLVSCPGTLCTVTLHHPPSRQVQADNLPASTFLLCAPPSHGDVWPCVPCPFAFWCARRSGRDNDKAGSLKVRMSAALNRAIPLLHGTL